ncbi:MAG: hypothetical protein ACTSUE_18685 [Promethearchaeota archaeon]
MVTTNGYASMLDAIVQLIPGNFEMRPASFAGHPTARLFLNYF